jgi:hypothetical protein
VANFVALFDANVLYPASVRDLLLRLALTDLFRARWTDRIHDEWIGALLKQREDLTRAQLERTRALMNNAVPDCLVHTDGSKKKAPKCRCRRPRLFPEVNVSNL